MNNQILLKINIVNTNSAEIDFYYRFNKSPYCYKYESTIETSYRPDKIWISTKCPVYEGQKQKNTNVFGSVQLVVYSLQSAWFKVLL